MDSKRTIGDIAQPALPRSAWSRERSRGKASPITSPLSNPLNLQPLPRWITGSTDASFTSGAALHAIDQFIRLDPPWLGCWRMRQVLQASIAIARLLRLNASEADLRDADCLTRAGDDPGPAGRLYRLLRQLSARPIHMAEESLAALDDEIKGAKAGAEVMALLRADLALAKRLGWSTFIFFGATVIFDPSLRDRTGLRPSTDDPRLLATAAINAHAHAVTVARLSQRLSEAASQLRTRDGGEGLAQVLSDDCVAPWRMVDAKGVDNKGFGSDRAARRFCETLAEQGVLRLLTNRPTFRLYGL